MNRKEIVNCPEYKAANAALRYWYSLPEEVRKGIINLDQEPDVIDAYEEGVLYGWNNPNWISVEDELPPPHYEGANSTDFVLVYDGFDLEFAYYDFEQKNWHGEDCKEMMFDVTHWMPLPQPPRKEE